MGEYVRIRCAGDDLAVTKDILKCRLGSRRRPSYIVTVLVIHGPCETGVFSDQVPVFICDQCSSVSGKFILIGCECDAGSREDEDGGDEQAEHLSVPVRSLFFRSMAAAAGGLFHDRMDRFVYIAEIWPDHGILGLCQHDPRIFCDEIE